MELEDDASLDNTMTAEPPSTPMSISPSTPSWASIRTTPCTSLHRSVLLWIRGPPTPSPKTPHNAPSTTTPLQPVMRPGLTVGAVNGERVMSTMVCADVPITIGSKEFHIDHHPDYELVLGCHWIRSWAPFSRTSTARPWHSGSRITMFAGPALRSPWWSTNMLFQNQCESLTDSTWCTAIPMILSTYIK